MMNNLPTLFKLTGQPYVTAWLSSLMLLGCIILSACGSSSDNQSPVDDDPGTGPSIPGDLRATVYSSHEAELFWSPSTDDGWVMGYDIFRNGNLVQKTLDANSYFEATLEPATNYQYSIVAVDDNGNRSAPAEVSLTTLDGPILPIINRTNYVDLLSHVFKLIAGDVYNKPILAMKALVDDETNSTSEVQDHTWYQTFNCQNDGTGESQRDLGHPDWDLGINGIQMQFMGCLLSSGLYDGFLDINFNHRYQSERFEINDANGTSLIFSGTANRVYASTSVTESAGDTWSVSDFDLTINYPEGQLQLSDANSSVGFHVFRNGFDPDSLPSPLLGFMSASFAVRSPWTHDQTLVIRTPTEFQTHTGAQRLGTATTNWQFEQGVLVMTATDGSELRLNAANGDLDSVTITFNDADASTTVTQPWSLWRHHLQLDTIQNPDPFETDIPSEVPVIRLDSHVELLRYAFSVMTGNYRGWSLLQDVLDTDMHSDLLFYVDDGRSQTYKIGTCSSGGTSQKHSTINTGFISTELRAFDNCVEEEQIRYDGVVRVRYNVGGRSLASDGLLLHRDPDLDFSFSGWLRSSHSITTRDSYGSRDTRSVNIRLVDEGGVRVIKDANIVFGQGFWSGAFVSNLYGKVIVQAPETGNRLIAVHTPTRFNYTREQGIPSEGLRYQTGQMRLLADDGSELLLNADTGDDDTVQITVTNSGGTEQVTQPWSLWNDLLVQSET